MLESTHVAQSGLERGLAALAQFGLVRPSNVLLTEYLAALTAEDVLEAAAAARLSAVCNRVRYSAVGDHDPEVQDAVATLESVATRLTAMSADERRQIVRRVRERLPLAAANNLATDSFERETASLSDARTPIPPTRHAIVDRPLPAAPRPHTQPMPPIATGPVADSFGPLDELDAVPATPVVPAVKKTRGLPRLSLELAAIVALATFFGGYFMRDVFKKTVEAADEAAETTNYEHLTLNDAWKNQGAWVHGVRARGDQDAQAHRFEKARLALELVHAYVPNDAAVLNDLAALYLTRDEAGRSDPKRALELIEQALKITRQSTILDTAAEAHFQCGHVEEAIRLEHESLSKEFAWSGGTTGQFRQYREQQLQRYRDAEPVRTAQIPSGSTDPGRPAAATAQGKINAPLAAQPATPAGT